MKCALMIFIADETVIKELVYTGSKINFFWQAPTGNQNFFLSRQMENCGRQKVSVNPM